MDSAEACKVLGGLPSGSSAGARCLLITRAGRSGGDGCSVLSKGENKAKAGGSVPAPVLRSRAVKSSLDSVPPTLILLPKAPGPGLWRDVPGWGAAGSALPSTHPPGRRWRGQGRRRPGEGAGEGRGSGPRGEGSGRRRGEGRARRAAARSSGQAGGSGGRAGQGGIPRAP